MVSTSTDKFFESTVFCSFALPFCPNRAILDGIFPRQLVSLGLGLVKMTHIQFGELVRQLRAGNNRPMKVLFERYSDYCVAGLQRHVHCSPEDAEDIFQDAVLVFRENALYDKIQYTTNLKDYLYSICFNLHRARQQQRVQRNGHRQKIAEHLYDRYEVSQVEKDIHQQEQQTIVKLAFAAFDRLGENCQRLLTYFYIDELDNTTIARKMNLANTNVVKSNKLRCVRRWAKHLREVQKGKAATEGTSHRNSQQ